MSQNNWTMKIGLNSVFGMSTIEKWMLKQSAFVAIVQLYLCVNCIRCIWFAAFLVSITLLFYPISDFRWEFNGIGIKRTNSLGISRLSYVIIFQLLFVRIKRAEVDMEYGYIVIFGINNILRFFVFIDFIDWQFSISFPKHLFITDDQCVSNLFYS